ncbi:hypothetical protein ABEB36_000063 [Hypothenemus hampei]|uniref:Uncharacterized protein n=1 Tax=Hypothenemus hampei TaxID=57062 RepID=A0ABD1FBZ5_HYPHA
MNCHKQHEYPMISQALVNQERRHTEHQISRDQSRGRRRSIRSLIIDSRSFNAQEDRIIGRNESIWERSLLGLGIALRLYTSHSLGML